MRADDGDDHLVGHGDLTAHVEESCVRRVSHVHEYVDDALHHHRVLSTIADAPSGYAMRGSGQGHIRGGIVLCNRYEHSGLVPLADRV